MIELQLTESFGLLQHQCIGNYGGAFGGEQDRDGGYDSRCHRRCAHYALSLLFSESF
jgi:hypothetical protein